MDTASTASHIWQLGDKRLDCAQPRVMAIANATPDSFHAASRLGPTDTLAVQLEYILAAQPDILDVGGQSTRPGSPRVDSAEEARRVLPVIELARRLAPALPITVDTYSAEVARAALTAGADGINDISAGRFDPALLEVVADSGCGYVLMHMQGTPETMQQQPSYADCVGEVGAFLEQQLVALEQRGIARQRVVLDPGIGFGKRLEDNLALIREARRFRALGRPLLYGISRKAFIGRLGFTESPSAATPPPAQDTALRLPGTLALSWELLNQGVMLHRVHDPAELRQVFRLWQAVHG